MTENEPNMITSSKSQRVVVDGYVFSIEIYRLETDNAWALEVVDHEGTSHVWDTQFSSDQEAQSAALKALESEGATTFIRGDNVVAFRKS